MIPAPTPDDSVPFHFGAPARESRAFEEGRAVVALASEIVTVAGPDRLTWLNAITSQQFTGMSPGASSEALIMSPNGHVEHAFGAVDDGDATWLVTDAGRGEALAEYLRSMQFASRVEVAVRDDLAAVAANTREHPLAADALALWQDPWPATTGTTYGPLDADHPASGTWNVSIAVIPKSHAQEGAGSAGDVKSVNDDAARDGAAVPGDDSVARAGGSVERAGIWAFEAARIAAWRPRFVREVDDRTLPHELDWLRTAVHMDKGCYRGQETVARVVNLGRPPRRLVFLHLDGSTDDLPPLGAEIRAGGKAVGRVTSAARHHELGPIALGVVKRNSKTDDGVEVAGHDGPVPASVEEIVNAGGVSAATPSERPGAALRGSQLGRRPSN